MRPSTHVTPTFSREFTLFRRWTESLGLFCLLAVLISCQSGGSGNGGNGGNGGGGTPALSAKVTEQGNFSNGQQNAVYNITVSNIGTGATTGTVTVTDPPTGFTITAMNGTGWSCTASSGTCTRTDALAAGQSYPPIVVTGNVTSSNGTPVSIPLNVSGGGISTPVTTTPTVTVAAPALTIAKTHTGNFNLGQQGATYTVTVANGATAGATNAKVTVTETVPSGETLVSMAGNGWTCPGSGGTATCDRSDTLTTNASYPPITVTVNVSTSATSPQVNQVTVSGGGMASSVSKTDSTNLNLPDLSISKSHSGAFTAGTNETFNIAVSNASGAGPTAGAITVTDSLDSHFTYVSGTASGWSCGAASQVVTCTNPGPLAPGASATTIPLVVAVSPSASGTLTNTATVSTPGESNLANNSSTDTVTFGAVDLSIRKSHAGAFTAGGNGTFNIDVQNVGGSATTGAITVTDTLPSQFSFVSGIATGWGCSAVAQVVTCTNPGPIAAGVSAPTIPLVVGVSASATGTISNTATVATAGDTNSVNNSSTDSVTLGPDLSISKTHTGNFGSGLNGIFSIAVTNVGGASTSGTITVTDTLDSNFTFKSANAPGWNCSASGQTVTCTNAGPLAPGVSAATIPLVVAVNAAAPASLTNTATVSTTGDTNSSNNSSTDTVNVIPPSGQTESISLTVPGGGVLLSGGAGPGGVIYAGGNSEAITVTVANEAAGDMLTPTLTLSGGGACSAATCGTIGAITGTSSPYTLSYTPPPSLSAVTTMTLSVTSSIAGAFAATANFQVYPANTLVVKVQGLPGGNPPFNFVADVFNDSSGLGATAQLLGAGYACPPATGGGTVCGTLTKVSTTPGGITTSSNGTTGIPYTIVALSYSPPAAIPNSPYDRPSIVVVANADYSAIGQLNNFFLVPGSGTTRIYQPLLTTLSHVATVFAGGPAITLTAGFGGDVGVNKTVTFTLTANGSDCQPSCGTLGTPTYTRNGAGVTASIAYTPPATVPSGAAAQPTITATPVDPLGTLQMTDSTTFSIESDPCGTGSNGMLNGQYTFVLQGGGQGVGYAAFIGSFTADGNGNITAGILDSNRTGGAVINTVLATGSSYSVGSDGQGCLTFMNSAGAVATYRFALGSVDGSGHATQGRIMRFDDNSGAGVRAQGILAKQDTTAFSTPLSGTFVFGLQGVTSTGARLASAGVETLDGSGHLTNFDTDAADGEGNVDTNDTSGSGTYSTAVDSTTGRGTSTANGIDSIFYVINSSEIFSMSTDPLSPTTPIVSGESIKQTTTSYTQTSLDGNAYVFYATAVDPYNGGNASDIGQVAFNTNGANTGAQYINDAGTESTQTITGVLTIGANGRATNSDNSLVFYLIGTDSAFMVQGSKGSGNPLAVPFGYVQQQTQPAGGFTNASISGQLFFGGGAPIAAGPFDIGTASFDGQGTMTLSIQEQGNEGAEGSETVSQPYSVTSASTGEISIGNPVGAFGFIVPGSRIVLTATDTGFDDVEILVGQK